MKRNDWLQLLGMGGVIASLVFVGLEMRLTREIAISQTYQSRAESEIASALESAANPAFHSGVVKLYDGHPEDLTPEESVALDYQFGALVTLWENDHFQYQNGYLSEEHWDKTVQNMLCTFGSPFNRSMLDNNGWHFRRSFTVVLKEIADQAKSDPLNCWDD